MAFDITSWDITTKVSDTLPKIKESLRALRYDNIVLPATHTHTGVAKVATTASIVLSGLQTIDSVIVAENDIVLVKDQADKKQNGLYYAKTGAWSRLPALPLVNTISNGAVNSGVILFLTTNDPVELGTSLINYATTLGSQGLGAGNGIDITNNLISIANTGVVSGSYTKVIVNSRGQVTGGSNFTTLASSGITDVYSKTQIDTSLATKAPSGYGLGTTSTTLNTIDLNTITAFGSYYCINCTNIPIAQNGFLLVQTYTDTSYSVQIFTSVSSGVRYFRNNVAGTWSAWKQVVTTDSPTFTGTVVLPQTTSIGTTTSAELGYVHGVTSSIQTQLNAKAPSGYGLGTAVAVNGLDTDSYKGSGYYYFANALNCPSPYLLTHTIGDGTAYAHIGVGYDKKLYFKWMANSWKEVATTDVITLTGTDLNTLKTVGSYYATTTCSNTPADYFIFDVIGTGTACSQFGTSITTGVKYERSYNNSTTTWSAWKKIVTPDSPTFSGLVTALNSGGIISGSFGGNGGTNVLALGNSNATPIIQGYTTGFATYANISLQGAGGNVGIGKYSPVNTLDVSGAIGMPVGSSLNTNLYYNSGWKYIANGYGYISLGDTSGNYKISTCPNNAGGAGVTATPVQRFLIDANGNTSIGSATPLEGFNVTNGGMLITGIATSLNYNGLVLDYNSATGESRMSVGGQSGVNGFLTFSTANAGAETERMRISSVGCVGIGSINPQATLHSTGSTILGVATSAVTDANIGNGQANIWINESTNVLTFRVRKSDGTYKTATLSLT